MLKLLKFKKNKKFYIYIVATDNYLFIFQNINIQVEENWRLKNKNQFSKMIPNLDFESNNQSNATKEFVKT